MPKFERNGVRLHYELDGSGDPVVFITGFSDHSNSVGSANLRRLFAEQYHVLAVDNRGSGQTVTPENTPTTIDDMADDIAAIMDEHSLSAAHVFGISMGGSIAMTLALRHPAKVRSLVIAVSLAANVERPTRADFLFTTLWQMRDAGVSREIINRYNAIFLLGEDSFRYERYTNAWVNAPADPYEQTRAGYDLQRAAFDQFDILDQIREITAPTLVVSSPDDILVPPHYQDAIAERIPNAELKRYPGGHVFMIVPMHNKQFLQDLFAFWKTV